MSKEDYLIMMTILLCFTFMPSRRSEPEPQCFKQTEWIFVENLKENQGAGQG